MTHVPHTTRTAAASATPTASGASDGAPEPSRRSILGAAGAAGGALLAGVVLSAPHARAQVPQGLGGGRGGRDPAQFREQMKSQLKDLLGSTDDEWKILEPKIDKVSE